MSAPRPPDPVDPLDADAQWQQAVAGGAPAAIMGELLGAVGQAAEAVLRRARRAVEDSRGLLMAPLLQRLGAGTSLREDLVNLLRTLAGESPDRAAEGAAGGRSPSATGVVDTLATDTGSNALSDIEQAISAGVDAAAAAGTVRPTRESDVIAWTLTSLIMTLAMRAREGDDTDQLVAVAVSAMDELLGPERGTRPAM